MTSVSSSLPLPPLLADLFSPLKKNERNGIFRRVFSEKTNQELFEECFKLNLVDPQEVVLYIQQEIGKGKFKTREEWQKIIPMLHALLLKNLIEFFKIKDCKGRTPLHNSDVSWKFEGLIKKLPLADLVLMLTERDNQEQTPLNDSYIVFYFESYFESRPVADFIALLENHPKDLS
jgi:hypothetical protein